MFAKKSRGIEVTTLVDASDYLIGVQRDSVTMQYLLERGYRNTDSSTTSDANLRKLMGDRNDLWFSSNATVSETAKRLGVDMSEIELVLGIEKTSIYIAFSKNVSDEMISRWQEIYDQIVASGEVRDFFVAHNMESLYPTSFTD